MEFKTLKTAKILNLVQLTIWLSITNEHKAYVRKVHDHILLDNKRISIIVEHNLKIAVFVDDVTK